MESLKTNGKWSTPKLIIAITGLITVLSGSALSWYKTIFGEPDAKEAKARVDITWKRVMREVSQMRQDYQKLHTRVLYFQGRDEGYNSGALQAKLDQVQTKYDELLTKTKPVRGRGASPVVDVLRGELTEVRKLKAKLEKERKGVKAAKRATQMEQKPAAPAPPPWSK